MKPIIILLMAFMLAGCMTDAGVSEPRPFSAGKFKSVNVSTRTISLLVDCQVPDPCWKFFRTDYNRSDMTYNAKIFAIPTGETVCPDVIGHVYAPLEVTVSGPGSYTFKFWRYDGTTLDTTVVVP